jgi:hypothetical protein
MLFCHVVQLNIVKSEMSLITSVWKETFCVKNVNYCFVYKWFMYRSYITTTNECSDLVMGWKTRYGFLSKARVSSCPPLLDCFKTHPDTKAIKSYPITGPDRTLGLQEVEATRMSRHSAYDGRKFASSFASAFSTPWRYPWYPFLLQDESIPGPWCCRKNNSMKHPNQPIGNRTRNLLVHPDSSTLKLKIQ